MEISPDATDLDSDVDEGSHLAFPKAWGPPSMKMTQ